MDHWYGEMNERMCHENMRMTEETLGDFDPLIGELFHTFYRSQFYEICMESVYKERGHRIDEHSIRGNSIADGLRNLFDSPGDDVDIITGDEQDDMTRCNSLALVYAPGKWNLGHRFGFPKLFKKRVQKYWADCQQTNRSTLIFTSAWDETDFRENYLDTFRIYSGGHRRIAVVLNSSLGPTVVYLG